MVAIAITMIFGTMLLVAANSFSSKERVSQVSTELSSYLNSARNLAVTSQSPTGFAMEYVAVTLSSAGILKAYPVNSVTGIGPSYFSRSLSSSQLTVTQIDFPTLLFAAGSGKLVAKNADPSYKTYPLPSTTEVGISIASLESGLTKGVLINAFGTINVR